jgi:hypothetical protein
MKISTDFFGDSIFILHGMHGGATKTFRHADTGTIWFRDLLPQKIRAEANGGNARIWSYGYPCNIAFATVTIDDFASTLLNRVKDVRKGYEVSPRCDYRVKLSTR